MEKTENKPALRQTIPALLKTFESVRRLEDVDINASVALMHQPIKAEFVSFLIASFCNFTGSEMSEESQTELAEILLDECRLWKPEHLHLFFKDLKKQKFYPRPSASDVLNSLAEFDKKKDAYFRGVASMNASGYRPKDIDKLRSGLTGLGTALGAIKDRLPDSDKIKELKQ